MIRTILALLLLVAAFAAFSGDARAHVGMAGHGPAVAEPASGGGDELATAAESLPDDGERLPGHHPDGKCCMTAAGCGGGGSILAGVPVLPLPGCATLAETAALADLPRGLALPVADRPPRRS